MASHASTLEIQLEKISTGMSFSSNEEVMSEESVQILIDCMVSKMQKTPLITKEAPFISDRSNYENQRCIFKLPPGTAVLYPNYYYPKIISIGPYHGGEDYVYEDKGYPYKECLRDGQKTKWLFVNSLFSRIQSGKIVLACCIRLIAEKEGEIRSNYREKIVLSSEQLVELMVLDGCFIIECLLRVTGLVDSDRHDSILQEQWKLGSLMSDLIKVENQIPYFVLKELLLASKVEPLGKSGAGPEITSESLPNILLLFFNKALGVPDYENTDRHHIPSKLHILDILHSSLVPTNAEEPQVHSEIQKMVIQMPQILQSAIKILFRQSAIKIPFRQSAIHHPTYNFSKKQRRVYLVPRNIHSASILRKKGIKIRAGAFLGLSYIKFIKGELWIPRLVLDDFTCSVLLNCIAYEQCNNGKPMYITGFAAILDSLVSTAEDVRVLRDSNVIEHFYGTDEEVAEFCNNLGKAFPLSAKTDAVWELFEQINSYCKDPRNIYWASFKRTYFRTLWIFISAVAAVILLLLTMTQTFFSAFSYFRPPK